MKSAIITWENFQDQEVVYPYYFLRGIAGEESTLIYSNVVGKFFGIMGVNMTSNALLKELVVQDPQTFDLVVLPGGVKSLEKLRQERSVVDWIRGYVEGGGILASTCHGAQLLISAGVCKGRLISGYYSLEDDIYNAGATYSREPVVIDDNLVTSPHYDFMGEWMNAAVALVREKDRNG